MRNFEPVALKLDRPSGGHERPHLLQADRFGIVHAGESIPSIPILPFRLISCENPLSVSGSSCMRQESQTPA